MKSLLTVVVCLLVFGTMDYSHGGVVPYSDRVTFDAQGTIAYNYGFEDVTFPDSGGYAYPGQPWTTHGVTYNGTENLLILTTCPDYNPVSNVLADTWGTIVAAPEVSYHMLAMDFAALDSVGNSSMLLKTNFNPTGYSFDLEDLQLVSIAQKFYGFVTDTPSEYFTGFQVNYTDPVQVAIDNVTLGTVPEPGSLTLLATALLGMGTMFSRRFRGVRAG